DVHDRRAEEKREGRPECRGSRPFQGGVQRRAPGHPRRNGRGGHGEEEAPLVERGEPARRDAPEEEGREEEGQQSREGHRPAAPPPGDGGRAGGGSRPAPTKDPTIARMNATTPVSAWKKSPAGSPARCPVTTRIDTRITLARSASGTASAAAANLRAGV